MYHSFDVDLAAEYGLTEAILLNYLNFWIQKNKANGRNFHDGCCWTYNSTRAFSELFPYLSQRKIQNALTRLKELGLIQTANYNQSSYDRTLWYALTEKGESVLKKGEIDYAKKGNGASQKGKSLNTVNNTVKDHLKDISAEFEAVWNLYPRKQGKKNAQAAFERARKKGVDYQIIEDGVKRYADHIKREHTPMTYVKQGDTWFRGECWDDDYGAGAVQGESDPELDAIF